MRGGCRNVQGKVRRRELRCRGKEEREERVGRAGGLLWWFGWEGSRSSEGGRNDLVRDSQVGQATEKGGLGYSSKTFSGIEQFACLTVEDNVKSYRDGSGKERPECGVGRREKRVRPGRLVLVLALWAKEMGRRLAARFGVAKCGTVGAPPLSLWPAGAAALRATGKRQLCGAGPLVGAVVLHK